MKNAVLLTAAFLAVGVTPATAAQTAAVAQSSTVAQSSAPPDYVYVWGTAYDAPADPAEKPDTAARPRRRGVVMLTIDLRERSATRGQVTHAILADSAGTGAHHVEYALGADGMLFANDFGTGTTHIFDMVLPGQPRLLGKFTTAGPYAYPHSFALLPNGNVLATYQWQGGFRKPPGGLAELRRDGSVVRVARAAVPGIDSTQIQPYSLEVLPALDRVVTTSTSMIDDAGVHVQIWRLSDLKLLHTMEIPKAPAHAGHEAQAGESGAAHISSHHFLPGEPRVLEDGRTVMFGTFTCGMYRLEGISETTPRLSFVHSFPGDNCAVPVRTGHWWVQTVPAERALVVLDVSKPANPREVWRLQFNAPVQPHWLAIDESGRRLVMTSGTAADPRVHLIVMNPATGAISLGTPSQSVDLSRVTIPAFGAVSVVPHGAVFSRPPPNGPDGR